MIRTVFRGRRCIAGFTLIDVLVGSTIALVAVVVIANVFTASESAKRNVVALGDAEVTAVLATSALGQQLANAGSAIAFAARELDRCDDPGDANLTRNFAKSWRPVPVLVIDGGSPERPDSIAISGSGATTLFFPAPVVATASGRYRVRSPNGFHPRAAGERSDLIVAIERPSSGTRGSCAAARADRVKDASGTCRGCVDIAFTGAGLAAPAFVFNMGPADDVTKLHYDVDVAKAALRQTRLVDDTGAPSAAAPTPIASNVVLLKAQYGIDADGDGVLDAWVGATGAWAPDKVMAAPFDVVDRIVAIRIGIVVRSEQFDREFREDVAWSLFEGALSGVFPQSASPPGNWRYRTHEATIPLRNVLWNRT